MIKTASLLKEHSNLKGQSVLVFGDVMLDTYVIGDANRMSPEAPVPIVHVSEYKYVLGGAANVAAGIAALGVQTLLAGVVGDDNAAEVLRCTTEKNGLVSDLVVSKNRRTTVKTRILGNQRQIVRFDDEIATDIEAADEAVLLEKLFLLAETVDLIIISDYSKGTCTERVCGKLIAYAGSLNKTIIVDTKRADWSRFQGASIVTPNFSEFKSCAAHREMHNNEKDISMAAKEMISRYNLGGILITRSQYGITYCPAIGEVFTVNAVAQEVFDVSGAGDTVVAALAVFLALGCDIYTAISIANTAAGIAVSKNGTYVVSRRELEAELWAAERNKLLSTDTIGEVIAEYRRRGMKIVFTNGCFDILHSGHISLLKQAKDAGDILVVGINSDLSIKRLKGELRPINSQDERAGILCELRAVDEVIIFDEDTPLELIEKIEPDILVKGGDYTEETIVGADFVKNRGGSVVIIPLVKDKSTSAIIAKMQGEH